MTSEAPVNALKLLQVPQGNKSVRTPAQLEMLAKARVKALEVRKFNASVKAAEKQTANIETTNLKKAVLTKYQKLMEGSPESAEVPVVTVATNWESESAEVPEPATTQRDQKGEPGATAPRERHSRDQLGEPGASARSNATATRERQPGATREIILVKKPPKPPRQKVIYYTDSEDEEAPEPPPILIKKSKPIPVPVPQAVPPRFRNPLTGRF